MEDQKRPDITMNVEKDKQEDLEKKFAESGTWDPKALFSAESDERVVNNIMRHQYRVLSDEEKTQMVTLKTLGSDFVVYCDIVGQGNYSRELSIAKTKMEEAVMWAVKHITK